MGIKRKNVYRKELEIMMKKRASYQKQYSVKKELSPELAQKVPKTLKSTLNTAFTKAFQLIFNKGTALIEKTYTKEKAEQQYQINRFAADLKKDKKTLRAFSKQSDLSNLTNLLISGTAGITMGLAGFGLPDIPVLTSMILRSLYELSTNYGYDYTKIEERYYQLLIIQGAMSYGEALESCLEKLDSYTQKDITPTEKELEEQIKFSAMALAEEMLFLKFVQGIPIIGVVGGISDSIFLNRIQRFAKLNYQYRILHEFE